MLKNFIGSEIKKNFGHETTKGQSELIDKLAEFVSNGFQKDIFLLKGYAGTGKTTIISALVKSLSKFKLKSVLLAPTGRAAKVITSYSSITAFTVHKKIYRQKSSPDGFGKFVLDKNLHTNTFFIVDEASMISNDSYEQSIFGSGRLLDDLVEYVYSGRDCKLILIGDKAQLPPVGMEISPALDPNALALYGLNVCEYELREVVRQSLDSGILANATLLRRLIPGYNRKWFRLYIRKMSDIQWISGRTLIEKITESYDRAGIENTLIVTRSNKRANKFNQGIRNTILFREEEISSGDFLMIVKNNYFWIDENASMDFIANGDIVEITRISNFEEKYGFRFADASLRFIDYDDMEIDAKILLDTLNIETASLSSEQNKELFFTIAEEYANVKRKKERYKKVRNNAYFNALQVKFAYAVTCHKAQGGQWKNVFIDQGFIKQEMLNVEYLRWLYTAFTRAIERLYLVNFKKEFFDENQMIDEE
ncbi:MAG: ATP-dependent endonuclease [Bacteroidia bacterium]|nr:MAG: ATP-dependent endonuclease [Bacteroidia bacterium]